jgi:hypothetical protein
MDAILTCRFPAFREICREGEDGRCRKRRFRHQTGQTIFRLILAIPTLLVIFRWLWPLSLPWWSTGIIAALVLVVTQYHFWSRLSSGSMFASEFPRAIVILFNWAFGAIALLAVLQILLDVGTLAAMLEYIRWRLIREGIPIGVAACESRGWTAMETRHASALQPGFA